MEETLLEYFEWYLPSDCGHWRRVAENASRLAALGFMGMWLPPAYKGHQGREDVGYGVYDLDDLGESARSRARLSQRWGSTGTGRQASSPITWTAADR